MTTTLSPLPRFTSIARFVGLLAQARGQHDAAAAVAQARYPSTPAVKEAFLAAIAAGGTGNAAALSPYGLSQELVSLERSASVIGRLLPFARAVPFLTKVPREITGASGSWVGQAAPIPVTNLALDSVTLERTKAAAIVVLSRELTSLASPAHESAIVACIKAALSSYLDTQFLDPAVAEVTDATGVGVISSPASITNGAQEIASTGTTDQQKLADLTSMLLALSAPAHPVWIMAPHTALSLAGVVTAGGAPQFPNITAFGGTLMGASVMTTAYMPTTAGSPSASYIVLLDAADLLIADDGEAEVDASEHASVQMLTNPATGATSLVSLWQTGATGIRISRTINWQRGHDGAVAYMEVSY